MRKGKGGRDSDEDGDGGEGEGGKKYAKTDGDTTYVPLRYSIGSLSQRKG